MHAGFLLVPAIMLVLGSSAISFMLWVLYHFHLESRRSKERRKHMIGFVCTVPPNARCSRSKPLIFETGPLAVISDARAQSTTHPKAAIDAQTCVLEKKLEDLQTEMDEICVHLEALHSGHWSSARI